MKNDERVITDVRIGKSIAYSVFWFGILAVLLYRWFILGQSLQETLDFFIIWLIASLVQFFVLAIKGIPITYPVSTSRKEQLYFVILVPLLTGVITAVIVFLRTGWDLRRIFGGFTVSFSVTLFLFFLYKIIFYLWEKKNM